jgi:hypothetical protein
MVIVGSQRFRVNVTNQLLLLGLEHRQEPLSVGFVQQLHSKRQLRVGAAMATQMPCGRPQRLKR